MKKIKDIVPIFPELLKNKSYRIGLLGVIAVLIDLVGRLPYLNLILSSWRMIVIFWLLAVIILRLPSKASYVVGILFFGVSLVFVLLQRSEFAETLGVVVYFLLAIGIIQDFRVIMKKNIKIQKKYK